MLANLAVALHCSDSSAVWHHVMLLDLACLLVCWWLSRLNDMLAIAERTISYDSVMQANTYFSVRGGTDGYRQVTPDCPTQRNRGRRGLYSNGFADLSVMSPLYHYEGYRLLVSTGPRTFEGIWLWGNPGYVLDSISHNWMGLISAAQLKRWATCWLNSLKYNPMTDLALVKIISEAPRLPAELNEILSMLSSRCSSPSLDDYFLGTLGEEEVPAADKSAPRTGRGIRLSATRLAAPRAAPLGGAPGRRVRAGRVPTKKSEARSEAQDANSPPFGRTTQDANSPPFGRTTQDANSPPFGRTTQDECSPLYGATDRAFRDAINEIDLDTEPGLPGESAATLFCGLRRPTPPAAPAPSAVNVPIVPAVEAVQS